MYHTDSASDSGSQRASNGPDSKERRILEIRIRSGEPRAVN